MPHKKEPSSPFQSVQDGISVRSEKPIICAPPRLREVSPTLPLKQLQCSFDWRWPSHRFKEDRLALPLSTPLFLQAIAGVMSLASRPLVVSHAPRNFRSFEEDRFVPISYGQFSNSAFSSHGVADVAFVQTSLSACRDNRSKRHNVSCNCFFFLFFLSFFFRGVLRSQKPYGLLGTGEERDRERQPGPTFSVHTALDLFELHRLEALYRRFRKQYGHVLRLRYRYSYLKWTARELV